MKRLVLLVLLGAGISMTACQSVEVSEGSQSKTISSDRSLLPKNWEETPIPFYISKNVPETFVESILKSFGLWEKAAGKKLFKYEGRIDSEEQDFDGFNVIYWDPSNNKDGYLGVTHSMQVNKRKMIEADIVFHGKPSDYDDLTCNVGESACHSSKGKFDVVTTALHEVGHFLGFGHTNHSDHIMNPNFGLNTVIHLIDPDTLSDLQSVYNPSLLASIH